MKFGHDYQEHLVQGGFPAHWVASAISYRQLKKCIKRVQKELAGLGLDATTLALLLSKVEAQAEKDQSGSNAAQTNTDEQIGQSVLYLLSRSGTATPAGHHFQPKLLFAVDPASGEPVDARLAPETKEYLHQLALSEQLTNVRIAEVEGDEEEYRRGSVTAPSFVSSSTGSTSRTVKDGDNEDFENEAGPQRSGSVRLIEVPLTSDSEFFNMLQSELSGLAALQADEQRKLNSQVTDLSNVITKVTQPSRSSAKSDLAHWRQIFELYLDSRIFFATNEQDHGAHDSKRAQQNFQKFIAQLQEKHLDSHFRRKESRQSLEMFLQINMDLLQMLKFQEINRIAMTKILKKFDKRTSLDVKEVFPKAVQMPALSENVAKAVCYQVSTDLLTVVPQLDDYLCPVCFSVSYKPVRLRCQHVFCIRCLVVMQRERKDKCPLCRGSVVMEADSANIDAGLANFLIKFFPEEVKIKQKENERAAGVDLYGEAYNDKCHIM